MSRQLRVKLCQGNLPFLFFNFNVTFGYLLWLAIKKDLFGILVSVTTSPLSFHSFREAGYYQSKTKEILFMKREPEKTS